MNACCVYDFTDNNFGELESVKKWCKQYCKKWCFVGERGEKSKREHWQGRISLKVKKRIKDIPNDLKFNFSITSNTNKDNNFYIEKGDTAITEIYRDTDEEIYIPRQIREITALYAWQKKVLAISKIWDTRRINLLFCPTGNAGKSTLLGYARAHRLMRVLPPVNDAKDLLRMVCNMPTATAYSFDMPRAMNKDRLYGFYTAIETLKDGYAYDDRYKFTEKIFDCPNIWIFTNQLPDTKMLSEDRWQIWTIEDYDLKKWKLN